VGVQAVSSGVLSANRDTGLRPFDLVGGATDRQTVASWFEASGSKPKVPDSVGRIESPVWAQSLPLSRPDGAGGEFDEFEGCAVTGKPELRPGKPAPMQNAIVPADLLRETDDPVGGAPYDSGAASSGRSAGGEAILRSEGALGIGRESAQGES